MSQSKSDDDDDVLITGPSFVHLFTPGCRVVRGPDWKWDNQDGKLKLGTILPKSDSQGWLKVKWDSGNTNSYRMGNEGCYDLKLIVGEQVLKDITKSQKWPVSEKLSKVLFTSPLPNHLECEICLDVLSDPIQTSCCGQGYCKDCINKIQKQVCPHCREDLEVFPDKKSIRLINELEVKCPYHVENKCQWKGSPSELKNHLKSCDIKPVFCSLGCGKQFEKKNEEVHSKYLCSLRKIPCKYCKEQVMKKDMTNHHEVCPKMPLPCPNKCTSGKEIIREKMMEHIKICPDQEVSCKYSEFGCNIKVKRKELEQHLSSAMEQHLYLATDNARNARKMLERKIEDLEKKVNQLMQEQEPKLLTIFKGKSTKWT